METGDWRERLDARLEGRERAPKPRPPRPRAARETSGAPSSPGPDAGQSPTPSPPGASPAPEGDVAADRVRSLPSRSGPAVSRAGEDRDEAVIPRSGIGVDRPGASLLEDVEHDDRVRSLRVAVILACFGLGLVLGVLYHLTQGMAGPEPPDRTPSRRTSATGGLENPLADATPSRSPDPVAVPEPEDPIDAGSTETILRGVADDLADWGSESMRESIPPLPKRAYGGLSARNAPLSDSLPGSAPADAGGLDLPGLSGPDLPVGPRLFEGPDLEIGGF